MARALLSSIDIISLDDAVVSVKSALYIHSICPDKGSCPPLRKFILATQWLVLPSGPMRVQPSNVRAAQGCLRRPRRSSKTQCASGTSLSDVANHEYLRYMECFSSKLEDSLQYRHDQGVYSHSTSRLSQLD